MINQDQNTENKVATYKSECSLPFLFNRTDLYLSSMPFYFLWLCHVAGVQSSYAYLTFLRYNILSYIDSIL